MEKSLIIKALVTWLAFIPLAFLNGTVRQFWYQPKVGELAGHQISTFTGSLAFVALAYFMMRGRFPALPPGSCCSLAGAGCC